MNRISQLARRIVAGRATVSELVEAYALAALASSKAGA